MVRGKNRDVNTSANMGVQAGVRRAIPILCLLALASGCTKRVLLERAENEVQVDGLVAVWATEVVVDGAQYDIALHVENRADFPIVIRARDLLCSRGDRWGQVLPGDDATVRLEPDQRRLVSIACRLAGGHGNLRVVLAHLFEEPTDQLLATDVEWFIADEL